jgi:hypothetical protein
MGLHRQEGKMKIEPRFDRAEHFRSAIAHVQIDEEFGYINKSGQYVWKPTD